MSSATLDKQIANYLTRLNERQKKAILTVVKTFINDEDSLLSNEDFVKEMDRRMTEMESGKEKGHNWEEVKQRARHSKK